jgi:hypothetical protein
VAADAAPLSVVGHEDHRGLLEPPARLEKAQQLTHAAVGLRELVEVLRAPNPPDMAELVRREQLQYEQIRILLLDDAPALGHERAVDLRRRLDRGDRADNVLAERVEQVRDADQATATALPSQHVEDRLDPHTQARGEVRAHAVLGRRRSREHRGEADDRARRVRGLDRQVLGALPGEAVDHGGVGLTEAGAIAAVDDDHVDAARDRCSRRARSGGRGVARQPAPREAAPREGAERRDEEGYRRNPHSRADRRLLGEHSTRGKGRQ